MTSLIPTVVLVDGSPRVSSLDIAERFGKSHDQVLKAIRKIMAGCPAGFNAVNFDAVDYLDAKGEKRPAYSLTRDAFSLVAMGFTGKEALAWKVRYIEAFNAMETELVKKTKKALSENKSKKPAQKALPDPATLLAVHAVKVQAAMLEVRSRGTEFIAAVLRLQTVIHRPVTTDIYASPLTKALERNLPVFGTSIGMNVSALSEMMEVYEESLNTVSENRA